MAKKRICFFSNTVSTSEYISQEIERYLRKYAEVKAWCFQESAGTILPQDCDIYVAANPNVLNHVYSILPQDRPILLAARTINTKNLDKLLKLEPGTRGIVIGSTEGAASTLIRMLLNMGFRRLDLAPYYPGSPLPPREVDLAITTGLANMVPAGIRNIVDLGGMGLDLSTYAEIIHHLQAPMTLLNDISHRYIEAILQMTIRSEGMAKTNLTLKRNLEIVLDTVQEAILAINKESFITHINPAAEKLLSLTASQGKNLREVLPQLDLTSCLQTGEMINKEIVTLGGTQYILTANPNTDGQGVVNGVVVTLNQVKAVQELESKVRRALKHKGNVAKRTFQDVIGNSEELHRMIELAKRFARTDLTILLQGESGTGKELIAQAIHNHSPYSKGPFVALNFAALPENLVESELFGYEGGAFTGAKKGGKAGLFEEAHLGTILLDEIGDAQLEVQKKLLRVLEEREVRRVGGNITTPVKVRVIAATNQDLEALVAEGYFRKDLYYRLCTVPILIPALRKRPEDIRDLLDHFLELRKEPKLKLSPELGEFFHNYHWPGNVRELENVTVFLRTAVEPEKTAGIKDLPEYLERKAAAGSPTQTQRRKKLQDEGDNRYELLKKEFARTKELQPITCILQEMHQSSAVKKRLGRTALQKRLKSRGLTVAEHEIRRWLRILGYMGFIDSGVTRQGSTLTPRGEEFLRYLQQQAG